MKRIPLVFSFVLLILFLFSTISMAFASIKLDGSITPAETECANIQIQCDNGNSGCGLYVLVTYYKPFPESSEIYLALNAELDGEEILTDGPFGFEIYIEDSPVIRIYPNSRADFDSSYYDVKLSNRIDFSYMRCETSILFKNHLPQTPEIYVKVIDNNGIASKRFKINTIMSDDTAKEESTDKNTKSKFNVTKNSNEQPSQNITVETNKESIRPTQKRNVKSSQKSNERYAGSNNGTKTDSSINAQNDETAPQYNLSNLTSSKDAFTAKNRKKLILISAISVICIIIGAAILGIKTNSKKNSKQ